jgi:hypothetical protein
MSRRSAGPGPKNVLKFPRKRRTTKGFRGRSSPPNEGIANPSAQANSSVQKELARLRAENAELRVKAVDLILQIQALRDTGSDGSAS